MKNMLLMRYRAIAASLYQYILTRGTMYGKSSGFANGRERPAVDGAGDSTTALYQIANGILKWVDTALLHSVMGTAPDAKAMGKEQYTENLLLQSKTFGKTVGSPITYGIVFGRGRSLTQVLDRGLGRVATAELGFGKSITKTLHSSSLNPAGIRYGGGNAIDEFFADGLLCLIDVIHGGGMTFIRNYGRGFLSDADIIHGRGSIIGDKVLTNSGISLEDLIQTRMYLSKIKENHRASIMTQGLENILAQTMMDNCGSAGGILLDMHIETCGLLLSYLRSISDIEALDLASHAMMSESTTKTKAGAEIIEYGDADYWRAPEKLDNNTLYIRSVYKLNHNGAAVYIE